MHNEDNDLGVRISSHPNAWKATTKMLSLVIDLCLTNELLKLSSALPLLIPIFS
jgi:hypothetical protein